jgi:uncharacterized protein with GYD domain
MPTYISLVSWTDEGAKSVKETVNRAEQVMKAAERIGGRFQALYWTQGDVDLVSITEFPDDDTSQAFLLQLATTGTVRTQTLRAFTIEDMRRILGKLS